MMDREYIECGERSRRAPNGALAHGMGEDFGPMEGCGIRCHVRSQMYRCAECDVGFCKACLLRHFTRSRMDRDAAEAQMAAVIGLLDAFESRPDMTTRQAAEAIVAAIR